MKVKLLTLAVSASLLATGLAYAEGPSFYGRVDASVQKTNKETATAKDAWELVNNDSRFGVKGSDSIDDATTAFYQIEWGVDVTGDAGANVLSGRNQFAGLHSETLGDVMIGRMDTPLKAAQGSVDLFNDRAGDMKFLFGSTNTAVFGNNSGEIRQTNMLAYRSNKIADSLQVNVMVSPGENVDVDGTAGTETGLTDSYAASVVYDKDGIYGAIAYDSAIQKWDHVRLVGGVTLGDIRLGGIYQQGQDTASATSLEADGYMLSAAYSLYEGSVVLKGEYGANKEKNAGATTADRDLIAVGVEHPLSKKAKVYAEYVQFKESVANTNDNYLSFGTQVAF